jgi:hypothetical protein
MAIGADAQKFLGRIGRMPREQKITFGEMRDLASAAWTLLAAITAAAIRSPFRPITAGLATVRNRATVCLQGVRQAGRRCQA